MWSFWLEAFFHFALQHLFCHLLHIYEYPKISKKNENDLKSYRISACLASSLAGTRHYSRAHKSSDSFFSKILEKPSIMQKKMILHMKGLRFSLKWSKKKFKMADSKNSKWPPQKNLVFQLRQFSIFFFWKFYGLVLGLVELIVAKDIDVAQPIWSWDCPT